MLETTAWALNGVPSWNFTPLRRWKVYVSPFGETVQLVARSGVTLKAGVSHVSVSKMFASTGATFCSLVSAGSSESGVCAHAMVRVWLLELAALPDDDELPQAATASASAARIPAPASVLFFTNIALSLQSLVEVVAQTIADQIGADDEQS